MRSTRHRPGWALHAAASSKQAPARALHADGVLEQRKHSTVDGRWTVTGADSLGTGRDCDGVVVTLTAPASPRFPDGTWTATSGKTGTFAVAKE
jgi:hypothetical protein